MSVGQCPPRWVAGLVGIRQDIDAFLSPEALALAEREVAEGTHSGCVPIPCGSRAELVELQAEEIQLRDQLQDLRREAAVRGTENERQVGREAAELVRARCERDDLAEEHALKRRKLEEVEGTLVQTRRERDDLRRKYDKLAKELKRERESSQAKPKKELERLQRKAHDLREEMSSASAPVSGSASSQLLQRVAELETENASLQAAVDQGEAAVAGEAKLIQEHAENTKELQRAQVLRQDLSELQVRATRLEKEDAMLRAALKARDAALLDAEGAAHDSEVARHELAEYAAAVEAAVRGRSDSTEATITSVDLLLAWTRLQGEAAELKKRTAGFQQNLDTAELQGRRGQHEAQRLRDELRSAEHVAEERRLKMLQLQVALSELQHGTKEMRGTIADDVITAKKAAPGVEARKKLSHGLEQLTRARQATLTAATAEIENLRIENTSLEASSKQAESLGQESSELSSKLRGLERRRVELDEDLQRRLRSDKALSAADEEADLAQKIAALRKTEKSLLDAKASRTSDGCRATSSADPQNRKGPEATEALDAELVQKLKSSTQELELFKKAMKGYIEDFRGGIYRMLGWTVEMRGAGNMAQWHVKSKYQAGKELVFVLRPYGEGSTSEASFDLLSSPWGEELQGDRNAMAYLQVYNSIPGFLAQVTVDSLYAAPKP